MASNVSLTCYCLVNHNMAYKGHSGGTWWDVLCPIIQKCRNITYIYYYYD